MAAPKASAQPEQVAWQVAAKFEPRLRAALEAALSGWRNGLSIPTIEAYIVAGDLSGLSKYLDGVLGAAAAPVVLVLDAAVKEAGARAAADVNAALAAHGKSVATQLPFPSDTPAGIVFQGVTPEFAFSPVNPKTLQAVRMWQGNLIREMTDEARAVVMDAVRSGLTRGANPRSIAVDIRQSLTLTRHQNAVVQHYADDLSRIAETGIRSATSWGIYTPRQIASLKAADPAMFRRLNFTASEITSGRRWAKISRASGTLAFDPKTGIKASKPIGFVAPKGTESGFNAFRLTPDGKPLDAMTAWRLRDKRFDPMIYRIVEAGERVSDARKAMVGAADPAARKKAQAALERASAAQAKAQADLGAAQGDLVGLYRDRMLQYRSQTIARTEALRAANLGSYEAWRQTIEESDLFEPQEVKREWITAKDDRVRMTHRFAAGQKVLMNQPFHVDGDMVMFPPHQPNCRCTVGYRVELGATA